MPNKKPSKIIKDIISDHDESQSGSKSNDTSDNTQFDSYSELDGTNA